MSTEPATLAEMIFLRPDKEFCGLPEGRSRDKVCFAKSLLMNKSWENLH